MPSLLLSRPDRVGDVLIATACLEPIRRQFPDWQLTFAAREVMRPLLEGHPLLSAFIPVPAPGKGHRRRAWDAARNRGPTADALRAAGPDAIVHLHPDPTFQLAARAARIPRRIGYQHSTLLDRWTLTDALPDSRREGTRHESQYNFDLLAPLGITAPPIETLRPSIHLDPHWRETLLAKQAAAGWGASSVSSSSSPSPNDYLVINPTAFSLELRWPPARFAALARALRRDFTRIVMVAERADDPSVVEIRRHLAADALARTDGWFIDLSGQTNLAELAWLLHDARLLVSRNTGTAHLASAVGCPLVELFGRLEGIYGPSRWRALGGKTRMVTAAADLRRERGESKKAFWRRCHAAIPLEEVLAAVRTFL